MSLIFFKRFSLFTFHPLIFFVMTFICGIIAQSMMNLECFLLFVLASCFVVSLIVFKKLRLKKIFLFTGFILGILCYKKQIDGYERFCTHFCNESYDVIATINKIQNIENSFQKQLLKLSIQELYNRKTNQKHCFTFSSICYSSQPIKTLSVGDTIKISNAVFKKPKNQAFAWYLLKEGCYTSFFIKDKPTILHRPYISLARTIFNKKESLLESLRKKMSLKCYTLFSYLFLGNKTIHKKYFNGIKERFKYWGLSHYLARSGLHLILFLVLFTFILRMIPISYIIKYTILSALCFIYALFSWSSISFIRALLTYFFYHLYIFFNVQINTLHILSLITIIILVLNPLQLFFLDFQLSFGLTYALALINHAKTIEKN